MKHEKYDLIVIDFCKIMMYNKIKKGETNMITLLLFKIYMPFIIGLLIANTLLNILILVKITKKKKKETKEEETQLINIPK